ncbi:uncharacterized protein DNG_04142 [Cephalotrichum gorgonifer]|uniref:Heterokaryon incompatibility domain-containing protein n=1 Tax=Cephalotrichum gorgonifer TaxID=2041049 RepID=A0AAE8SU92_9PEZI|nr:uncharacterized protein DNG_04142 [Cephalotrichum gorgonifer]
MIANTSRALPPIDFSSREIRLLDFSHSLFPRFSGSSISCTMATVSLRGTPKDYTIISHVPSPGEELVECLVVDGELVSIPAGLARAFETLDQNGAFLSMAFPVRLWVEAVCVDWGSADEQKYLHSVIPDIYKQSAGLMCYLGGGDTRIRTFLGVTQHLFRHVPKVPPNTRGLSHWAGIFLGLARYNRSYPETLAEYSELTVDFFKHPFWGSMRHFQEYLSVKSVGLVYEDLVLWDCMLLEVAMMVLQQEGEFMPRDVIYQWSLESGPVHGALVAGLQAWRRLVQWELTRSFLKLIAKGDAGLPWQYIAQLAPVLPHEDDPDADGSYLHLVGNMLQLGHTWPMPLEYTARIGSNGTGHIPLPVQKLGYWLLCVTKLCASESTTPAVRPPLHLRDLLSVSNTHLSESPLFFLTHAGVGLHGRRSTDVPSWVPDYDTISRSPTRVPLTFEDPRAYVDPDYHRYNPIVQGPRLVVRGIEVGRVLEVREIPESDDIMVLFCFLDGIGAGPETWGALRLVRKLLFALLADPHDPATGATFHRFVGTVFLTPLERANPLFRLLGVSHSDHPVDVADRVKDLFFPELERAVADAYAREDGMFQVRVARCLAVERIDAVRKWYVLGRVGKVVEAEEEMEDVEGAEGVEEEEEVEVVEGLHEGRWGLVPGYGGAGGEGAREGDGVFRMVDYGAGVVLRDDRESGYRLVGACGVILDRVRVRDGDWERIEIR